MGHGQMIHRLAITAVGLGCLLLTAGEPVPRGKDTQRFDFPPNGSISLINSAGEVTIEAWDRPEVEITTIKTTRLTARELEKVDISTQRRGDEIVVTTGFPRHRRFRPSSPLRSAANVDLQYEIKVPRGVRVNVEHGTGEVHVVNVTGDIRVTSLRGVIALLLPEAGPVSIDARSDLGGVISDFPGSEKRSRWLLGHQFNQDAAGKQNLYLRTGYGDILIQKTRRPRRPDAQPAP